MIWRIHVDRATQDYILGGVGLTAPAWMPTLSELTEIMAFLAAFGGVVLISLRIWRQWKYRNRPPSHE